MRVTTVVDDDVVLASDDAAREVVLAGAGLGLRVEPGDPVPEHLVERSFVVDGGLTPERVLALLRQVPVAVIDLAREVVAEAQGALGTPVHEHVVVPLADHLCAALRRAHDGLVIEYPLEREVRVLYPQEAAFAGRALRLVRDRTGQELPPTEAVPLTLHLVNARLDVGDMALTMETTEVVAGVLDRARREHRARSLREPADDDLLAAAVVPLAGGATNLRAVTACATRLRLVLADPELARHDALRALPGVLMVLTQAGELHVVLGMRAGPVSRAVRRVLG